MDTPMIISVGQLEQLQRIMFTHVDSNCQKTSVHNAEQSVARPIQRRVNEVQNCKKISETAPFNADIAKGRGPGKICRWS